MKATRDRLSAEAESQGQAIASTIRNQAQADAHSDTQFAEQLDARRTELQHVCKDLAIRWNSR